MACNAHANKPFCNSHSNSVGGEQPCPSNTFTYYKAVAGQNVIASRILAVRDELIKEEGRRKFQTSLFDNDVYISAVVLSKNLKELRDALDKLVDRSNYCWCNCNNASCVCDVNTANYCDCNCNNCVCNCNYCACNCNYCTCNCNYCTCNCNNCGCHGNCSCFGQCRCGYGGR